MDIVKSLALGAKSVAMAGRFLSLVNDLGMEEAISEVNNWKYQIKSIMTLLGSKNISELQNTDIILRNEVREWAELRNIDVKKLANRKK